MFRRRINQPVEFRPKHPALHLILRGPREQLQRHPLPLRIAPGSDQLVQRHPPHPARPLVRNQPQHQTEPIRLRALLRQERQQHLLQKTRRFRRPPRLMEIDRQGLGKSIADRSPFVVFVILPRHSLRRLTRIADPEAHLLGSQFEPRPRHFIRRRLFRSDVGLIGFCHVLHGRQIEQGPLQERRPRPVRRRQFIHLRRRQLRPRDVHFSQLHRREPRAQMPRRPAQAPSSRQHVFRFRRLSVIEQHRGQSQGQRWAICSLYLKQLPVDPSRHRGETQLLRTLRGSQRHRARRRRDRSSRRRTRQRCPCSERVLRAHRHHQPEATRHE